MKRLFGLWEGRVRVRIRDVLDARRINYIVRGSLLLLVLANLNPTIYT